MAQRFDVAALRDLVGDAVFRRGEDYARAGKVELLSDDGACLRARIAGTEVYRAKLRGAGGRFTGECSCPAFIDHGFCKHLVAAALAANAVAEGGAAVPDRIGAIRTYLRGLGAERLAEMLLDLAERDPALLDRLHLAASAASGDPDEVAERCRTALKRALRTGRFVEYGEAGAWTQGVLDLLDQLEDQIGCGQAKLVLEVVDDVFKGLPRALENVDDSDGGGSEIAERATDLHLAACEAARPDPVALAHELFRLETSEDFGTFAGASERYAHLLGAAGLEEYRRLAQAAWDRLPQAQQGRGGTVMPQEDGLARYRLFPILDRFADQAGDVDRRIALREAQLEHAHDYLRLVEFCLQQGCEAEAVRRAEEGAWLFDDLSGEPLLLFLAERHRTAGQAAKAEAVLWPGFERRPSMRLYEAMVKGKKASSAARAALADRAVALLEEKLGKAERDRWRGGDLAGLLVEILLRERRLPAAWAAARRHGCSDGIWRVLAEASESDMPGEALTAYERLVEQQVGLTNKHGYTQACHLVARMAPLRVARGEAVLHRTYIASLLARHRAKRNFVAMLRGMASV